MLARARESGRRSTCLGHLRQIGMAQILYLQDSDERFPPWVSPWPARREEIGGLQYWPELFRPYLRDTALLTHPSFAAFRSPDPRITVAEYALCTWGPGGQGTREDPYWRWPGPPLVLANVRRPAESFGLMDGYTTTLAARFDPTRHHGGMNTFFLDGHARWLMPRDLYRTETDGHGFHWLRTIAADM
jgi:prepilin-type processing-associated H-X9-DG protein